MVFENGFAKRVNLTACKIETQTAHNNNRYLVFDERTDKIDANETIELKNTC